jgi:hypothetical protein
MESGIKMLSAKYGALNLFSERFHPSGSPNLPASCVIGARGIPLIAGYRFAPVALPADKLRFVNIPG